MPIQKGKRRRKPRTRGSSEASAVPVASPATSQARPAAKSRFEPPLWFNMALGVGMVIFGLVYFVLPLFNGGKISTSSIVVLVLYLVVAGLYLSKAWRQRVATRRG